MEEPEKTMTEEPEKIKKKSSKGKRITGYIFHGLGCFIAFAALFAYLLIYRGPFTNLRDYIVSMSVGANIKQIFATWFLSKEEIADILAYTNPTVQDGTEDVSGVTVTKAHSNGVEIKDISDKNFVGKLMIIDDPARLDVGLAPKIGEKSASLSEIIDNSGAVGGINGGGFLEDKLIVSHADPNGITIQNGQIKSMQKGLSTYSIIGFTQDNVLLVSNNMTLAEIKKANLRCALSFGPALILNGQPLVKKGGATLQPRSAIAQCKDGTILLLAIDGRQSASRGATLKDVQDLLLQYGAYNAANLDGGSSTTLSYQGKILNNPCDITGERSIASAFVLMPEGSK